MKTILIVDDEGEMLAALAKMIERRGSAKVLTATTPEEGIKIYQENKPDGVFLDLHLSDITGIEVLQKLKQINPQVKAYFITGDQVFVDRNPPESIGVLGYLVKPIIPQELIKIIENL
ncbi:MAG: response regulator [Candidatus Omnitrophota bacterium]|nr:response regulator [Candidatus Omnitrophota bacterium]